MQNLTWTSFPVILLITCLFVEAVLGFSRKKGKPGLSPLANKIILWSIRPWAFWAVISIIYRAVKGGIFNNAHTYPFYANLWHPELSKTEVLIRSAGDLDAWLWLAVSLLLTAILSGLMLAGFHKNAPSKSKIAAIIAGLFLTGTALQLAMAAFPLGIEDPLADKGSLLKPWFNSGSTMLYATPLVENSKKYTRYFVELLPRLHTTIHGVSHPPWGSLALYWIGLPFGAEGNLAADRFRYALGLTLFNALNLIPLYFLGRAMFGSVKTGLLSAALWLTMPNTLAHATFAPDGVYAVFFHFALLFSWLVITSPRPDWRWVVLLGASFAMLTMMNYSWCVATTMFALFAGIYGLKHQWKLKDYLQRGAAPLAVMAVLFIIIIAKFRFNYLEAYLYAYKYVDKFYDFKGLYQWFIALVGGQIELFILMGSTVFSIFLLAMLKRNTWGIGPIHAQFVVVILGVYLFAVLVGPSAMKMEVSRCWGWVTAPALATAAQAILQFERAKLIAIIAVAVNILTYSAMRLFMCFFG